MQISATKFKATCLELIDRVSRTGEQIVITKRGKAMARLVPDRGKPKGYGSGRGTVEILCSDQELFSPGAGLAWSAGDVFPPARHPRTPPGKRRRARS